MNMTISPVTKTPLTMLIMVLILMLTGCGGGPSRSDNERLRETAQECLKQQAAQNERVVDLSRELASGAKELVQADAQSRQDFVGLQRELESSRANVDQQKTALDQERRQIAQERHWDSLAATGLMTPGLVLAALSPLLLAGFAVYVSGKPQATSDTANGLIIDAVLLSRLTRSENEPMLITGPNEVQIE